MKTTLSAIKADTGSIGGHERPSDAMIESVKNHVEKEGKQKGLLTDYKITYTGNDIAILMAHQRGVDHPDIHKLARGTVCNR